MRFNVATVQSAALNACNQVSVQPDSQTRRGPPMVRRMVGDAAVVPRAQIEAGRCGFLHLSRVYPALLLSVLDFVVD